MQVLVFNMSIYSNKEKMEGNDYKDILCRNHSAKADREMYRVCPSKLSKRELEDLYFTLLENNMDLKRTINGQNDKIRLLSTQVQRMTNTQEKLVSKDVKDRGTATKAVVDGQKDFISELKDTNKRLSDRIQQLNMRLCSAKQFLKTSPQQTASSRGNRSAVTGGSTPKKHECVKKSPESLPERILKVSTYSQWEDKPPSKSHQIAVPSDRKPLQSDRPCDENKCRTLMEELKLKIVTLENELFKVHSEYATRIDRLENEVVEVRKENIRVISERSASELERTDTSKRANDLLAQYRSFEAQCSELTTELAIERRKVAELETQLKAANITDKVNKTIEDHLTTKQETSGATDGGPGDDRPQDVSSRDSGPKDVILQDGGPLDVTPRTGFSYDGSSRDDGSTKCYCGCAPTPPTHPTPDAGLRDGVLQDGGPPDISPRAGFRRDRGLRDGGPRDDGPRDDTLRDAEPKDSILQDGGPGFRGDLGPRDGDPRDGEPGDGGPRADGPRDSVSRDGEPRDGKPRDVGPRDGGPRIFTPRDAGPEDSILQDGGTLDVTHRAGFRRDLGPQDGAPRDVRPREGGPRADGPQDSMSRDGEPRDGKSQDVGHRDGGPKDGILQDSGPLDVIPRAGFRRDLGPRDGKTRDGGLRVDGPRDSVSRDSEPRDGRPRDVSLQDGGLRIFSPGDGSPRIGGPQYNGYRYGSPRYDGSWKCHCGCPPTPPKPPTPPPVVNEKAPIKNLHPMLPPKKRDGLDDNSAKSSPTKYSMASSFSKYSSSYPTTTTSEDTNCERCGCKFQLTGAVPCTTPPPPPPLPPPGALVECECKQCACPPPYHLTTQNGKCAMCGYNPPEITSTPIKGKKKDVDCRCPGWVQDGLLKLPSSQETNAKCMKCCFKDELKTTESPSTKTDEGLPPTGGPTYVKDDLNTSNTNDSGYQDTDEQGLLKQNKELMAMILDLQKQIDVMKIGQVCGCLGCKPSKPVEKPRSAVKTAHYSVAPSVPPLLEELPKASEVLPEAKQAKHDSPDTKDTAPIHTRPLLKDLPQVEIPVEQIEKPIKDEIYETISVPSEDSVILPRKILRIEVLGDPEQSKASISKQTSVDIQGTTTEDTDNSQAMTIDDTDDTRAKTREDLDGTLQISDEPRPIPDDSVPIFDKYGYPDLPHRGRNRWDTSKFEIVGKKKREQTGISRPDPDTISLKSATHAGPGPGFNPEKFKYLEAEGLTATPEPKKSLTGSIPSNPELGFGIRGLASKASQPDKNKADMDFQTKMSQCSDIPSLHRTLSEHNLNMRDARLVHHPTQTDDTKKQEDCQYCAACSYDKECADATNPTIDNIALGLQKYVKKKDQHNVLQVPGPIPPKEKKRNLFSHFKKHKKESRDKEDLKIDPTTFTHKTSDTSGGAASLAEPLVKKREKKVNAVETQLTHDKSTKRRRGSQEDFTNNPKLLYTRRTSTITGDPVHLADVAMPENRGDDTEKKPPEESSQARRDSDLAWQGDVSWYRRHSGTYFYRTPPLSKAPLACRCVGRQGGACPKTPVNEGTQVVDNQENLTPREKRRAGSMSDRGTYTLGSKKSDSSIDNTDLDYLSDLPSEKEKKSPLKSRPLSPGEDRTTTYTSTHSGRSPGYYSLSEGEMPATTSKPRNHFELKNDRPYINTFSTLAHKLETPASQQMEESLQAITAELQRCKNLLQQQQRPPERPIVSSCSAQTTATEASNPIALKPALAQHGIGDKHAPVSVFTLHVGTVVLSDEAVLNSRDKNLVLKWKFYDQAVTMSRMRAERVMLFDFSTEYYIKVTKEFLNYLKTEQMPIVICEIGHEDQPFAYSTLPLRDALLNTNTRADMSIALMAGPQLKYRTQGTTDTLDSRDEVGVIDLWCMLHTDTTLVPGINLAIAQPGDPSTRKQRLSVVLPKTGDDNELELNLARSEPAATHEQTGKNQTYADVEYNRPSDTWNNPPHTRLPTESSDLQPDTVSIGSARRASYDPSKYPPLRDRARPSTHTKRASVQTGVRYTPENDQGSDIIINEVKPKIKAPGDVKYALERSNRLDDSKISRIGGASEQESLSQVHSSYGSLRSVLSRIQSRGSRHTQTHGGDQRNFLEKLRKASKSGVGVRRPSATEGSDMEIYKKYGKIAKLKGQPTRSEQSKKVTIQPEYFEPDDEKPERDIADGEQTASENQKRTAPQLEITILWLALNEECEAMIDPRVQRVYVAYTFLGRSGAELETPVSLPKPKHYVEKCYFNFKKVFELEDADFPKLGHMARCRASNEMNANAKDCIIFSVVSEPTEDPLGIESCEDIGFAFLYLGDLLAYSAGSPGYTEVLPVRAARGTAAVTGVLAVRLDGLDVVRRCLMMTMEH